jgi:CAAX protease family protein
VRVRIFFLTTFVITWGCWWSLAWLSGQGVMSYGQPLFMTLYLLGGFGPTIAAYVAVIATRAEAPLSEYHRRLFRWRVNPVWYLVALGLPFAIGFVSVRATMAVEPGFADRVAFKPWGQLVPLFLTMIIGGGLEELGWRGVAQPELERRMSRARAALLIGLVWAAWHLPLFSIPGVGQYGTSFTVFAVGVVGQAFLLAWLYARTGSILLCLMMHAMTNATAAMGLVIPTDLFGPAMGDALLKVALGVSLVWIDRGPARGRPAPATKLPS